MSAVAGKPDPVTATWVPGVPELTLSLMAGEPALGEGDGPAATVLADAAQSTPIVGATQPACAFCTPPLVLLSGIQGALHEQLNDPLLGYRNGKGLRIDTPLCN